MRNVLFTAMIVAAAMTTTWAQAPAAPAAPATAPARATAGARQATPPAPAAPATAAPPAPAPPPGSVAVQAARYSNPPRNVRFEILITETGIAKPSTKTVSLTVSDGGGSGSVRNGAPNTASLNVDVRGVYTFEGGAIRALVNVEYQPQAPDGGAFSSSITSMFQDGRKTQILQTADPLSDRRTSIEVTMTVLK